MRQIKPPELVDLTKEVSLFLAGSIEMGIAKDWQKYIADQMTQWNIVIFNPRRDNWDSSWEQKITNHQFYEQVNWELDHLERATFNAFYFDPDTKSPITLMELGISATTKPDKTIVCCPEGFWRKGNVDMVCQRFGVKQVNDLDQLISMLKSSMFTANPRTNI